VKFTTLRDARFSCHMSTACCKHDFEITLPPEAQLVIDAMPWETLQPQLSGTRLRVRADGKLQLKELSETCRFLCTQGRCLIHQTLVGNHSSRAPCFLLHLRRHRRESRWG